MELKEYRIEDIFVVSGSKCVKKDIAEAGDGYKDKTPYICRGASNNGCEGFFNFTPSQNKNCITVGSQGATAFYQPLDFFTGTGVLILRSEKLNENNAIYIMTALNKKLESFGYGYEVTQEKLKNIEISLPSIVHPDGTSEPDWEYMENYIANLRSKIDEETKTEIDVIDNVKKHRNEKIDVSEWKEYKTTDIFEFVVLKKEKAKIETRKNKDNEFQYPILNQSAVNNQVDGYSKSYKTTGNLITIDNLSSGLCFYQKENFSSIKGKHNMAIKLKNYNLNENIALFLIPILNKGANNTYDCQRSKEKFSSETIKLPSITHDDGTSEPDWEYMENYIKELKEKNV